MKLSHNQISGLNVPKQKMSNSPISNNKVSLPNPSVSTPNKKYGRNDKIKISNGTETKIIKFKKAEDLLNQGWNIIE